MKKYITVSFIITLVISTSQMSYGQGLKGLLGKAKEVVSGENSITEIEAGKGLKQALDIGVDEAVNQLSQEKGYLESPYKILLPEEADKVVKKLSLVPGFENLETNLVNKMNEAAEIAAVKAGPIFKDAILEITFDDALNILSGEEDAATRYLEQKSYQKLYDVFLPVIQGALDEVNARDLWRGAVQAYNKLPLVRDTNPELDDHVNNKALEGMFSLIETKEEGIRNNVDQRTTDLLKKVFGEK